MLGGIIGGFTYEYTHETKDDLQYFKRSFRRRTNLRKRNNSQFNSNSTISTEMGMAQTEQANEDMRI